MQFLLPQGEGVFWTCFAISRRSTAYPAFLLWLGSGRGFRDSGFRPDGAGHNDADRLHLSHVAGIWLVTDADCRGGERRGPDVHRAVAGHRLGHRPVRLTSGAGGRGADRGRVYDILGLGHHPRHLLSGLCRRAGGISHRRAHRGQHRGVALVCSDARGGLSA